MAFSRMPLEAESLHDGISDQKGQEKVKTNLRENLQKSRETCPAWLCCCSWRHTRQGSGTPLSLFLRRHAVPLRSSNLKALDQHCMWIGDTTNSVPKTQHLHLSSILYIRISLYSSAELRAACVGTCSFLPVVSGGGARSRWNSQPRHTEPTLRVRCATTTAQHNPKLSTSLPCCVVARARAQHRARNVRMQKQ